MSINLHKLPNMLLYNKNMKGNLMNSNEKSICEDFAFIANVVVGIGEVAELTGMPARQLRYWEEKGIIKSIQESDSKTRRYNYINIKKILLIKELVDEGILDEPTTCHVFRSVCQQACVQRI